MEGFAYVVEKEDGPKVAFGSAIARVVLPLTGNAMSPLMRRVMPDLNGLSHDVGAFNMPGTFFYKKYSTVGYGQIASITGRFNWTTRNDEHKFYDYYKPAVKQSAKPFGRSMKVTKTPEPLTMPGTYNIERSPGKLLKKYSFGGRLQIVPAVHINCAPSARIKCQKCNQIPIGDYLEHFKLNKCYCRRCARETKMDIIAHSKAIIGKTHQLSILSEYRWSRHCGYYHDHQNTQAKPRLLPYLEVLRRYRHENYMAKFEKSRII